MRILVLRGGALGDFIITLPALGLLRASWPDARIELAGNPSAAALALGRHYLDAVHAQSDVRWSRLGSGTLRKRENGNHGSDEVADWLATFDLVINFWPDADGAIAADFVRLGFVEPSSASWYEEKSRRFLTGSAAPQCAPAAAHFCAALAPLGLATADFGTRIFLNDEDFAAVDALLGASIDSLREVPALARRATESCSPRHKPRDRLTEKSPDARHLVVLHPGSGSPKKNWPLDRWLAVIDALRAQTTAQARHSFRVIVLLGEVERETWSSDVERLLPADTLVLRSLATPVLAAVLRRCALFLGHDSGPAHVAAAVGCPCVLVFGPTDPAIWAPPGEHVHALRRGESTNDVNTDEVLTAITCGSKALLHF